MKPTKLLLWVAIGLPSFTIGQLRPVDVAENTVKVKGFSEEIFYYGFAEGDQLLFNFEEEKDKDLKEVEIIELPSTSRYMDYKTSKITNKTLSIRTTGIYKFRFVNSAMSGRVCKFKIQRIPASEATKNFNSSVQWRTAYDSVERKVQERYLVRKEYKPVSIINPEKYYINSGRNALFQGGTSRLSIPIILPSNTVEWYYIFSSYRNEEDVKRTASSINLFSQLTKLVDPSGGSKIAINMLTAPPGGDNCDIYLLDALNRPLFEGKTDFTHYMEGSRENLTSGIINIKATNLRSCFIGIKNPDAGHGIFVTIEAVAIVLEDEWAIREVSNYDITSRKVAYLDN